MDGIFSFNDYKAYLRDRVDRGEWGAISRLADAAGCQRSYFSKVLHGEVHLTPDHAAGISDFLKHSEDERDFFMLLLEHGRASTPGYRKRLEKKMKALQQERENLSTRLGRPATEFGIKETVYYSAWYYSAIHILVSIPEFQTPESISKKLELPTTLVNSVLETLLSFQFVKKNGKLWQYQGTELHVPKGSPVVHMHHQNWRNRSIADSQMNNEGSVHFSAVQSVSKPVAESIKIKGSTTKQGE